MICALYFLQFATFFKQVLATEWFQQSMGNKIQWAPKFYLLKLRKNAISGQFRTSIKL
jgi:hypothetical protein